VRFLNLHYDKLLFVLSIAVVTLVACITFFGSSGQPNENANLKLPSFSIDSFGNEPVLIMVKESQILPRDIVKIFDVNSDDHELFEVRKVIFSKKSKVMIQLKSKKSIKGRLLNPSSTVLSTDWQKTRTPIAVETQTGIRNLNFNEIDFIRGYQKLILDRAVNNLDPTKYSISVYQSQTRKLVDNNRTEKTRWITSASEHNASIYDLFTPPIIYLIDGKLTTSLPEAPKLIEKEEEFGLQIVSFKQKPYRLKLVSWIGNTPYFEDLEKKVSEKSDLNVKNRIEVKTAYKENENYRSGAPSLVKSSSEDENKILMVEYFTVQQIKDPKTGGVRPVGRALIRDFQKGGKPFEINSLMEQAYSGDFQILLKFEIEGEPSNEIEIRDSDIGKEFEFNKRNFKILKIDTAKKTIEVEKEIPGKPQTKTEILNFSN